MLCHSEKERHNRDAAQEVSTDSMSTMADFQAVKCGKTLSVQDTLLVQNIVLS